MSELAKTGDMLICGAGTAPMFLEAGKPVPLLPYQAEQRVNADRIAATGAGLRLDENTVQDVFDRSLAQFIAEPSYTNAARHITHRWSGKEDAIVKGTSEILLWLQKTIDQSPSLQ